jgi:hypothetical protein
MKTSKDPPFAYTKLNTTLLNADMQRNPEDKEMKI